MHPPSQKTIVIAGYIVCGPIGGLVWHHLQYVLGLHRMGHDVLFVEDSQDYPNCYQPLTYELTTDPAYGLNFLNTIFRQYGLANNWAYFDYHTNTWHGKTEQEVKKIIDSAELYINLSGVDPLRDIFQKIPARIFIDTDPAFTQIRHLTEAKALDIAQRHNRFFSFGENFGDEDCLIPDDGFHWLPTRQPVVTSTWHTAPLVNGSSRWTTVMQWDSYKVREFNGVPFGMKSASFDDFIHLPQKIKDTIELAIGSTTAPREKLIREGWQIADPLSISLTPQSYQSYILQSKGEWSIAKHGYVYSNSGWFSERSCGYLASGKPVIVQDTGFSDFLPVGKGLQCFRNMEEAEQAFNLVNENYSDHCKAAREIAGEYFDSKKVLSSLIERL